MLRDKANFILDNETGEVASQIGYFDFETGEPLVNERDLISQTHKRKFLVPKSYLKLHNEDRKAKQKISKSFPLCGRKKVYGLKEEIILGYNTMSHRIVLFLPILFVFPKWPAILIGIFECLIHIWAHKKNKGLKDKSMYYRSPLHIMTSEFCAVCQSESQTSKIGRLQDDRKNHYIKNTCLPTAIS